MSKIDYKLLPNAKDMRDIVTAKELASEFETTEVKVSASLRAAELAPVGKLTFTDEATGKARVGKPTLAFNGVAARQVMKASISTEAIKKDAA